MLKDKMTQTAIKIIAIFCVPLCSLPCNMEKNVLANLANPL